MFSYVYLLYIYCLVVLLAGWKSTYIWLYPAGGWYIGTSGQNHRLSWLPATAPNFLLSHIPFQKPALALALYKTLCFAKSTVAVENS